MSLAPLGKILIFVGIVIAVLGVAFLFFDKIPFMEKLPGDIVVRRKNFTFHFPLMTSILFSLLLSAIFIVINIFRK